MVFATCSSRLAFVRAGIVPSRSASSYSFRSVKYYWEHYKVDCSSWTFEVLHPSPQRKQGTTRPITKKSGPDSLAGASGLDGKSNGAKSLMSTIGCSP